MTHGPAPMLAATILVTVLLVAPAVSTEAAAQGCPIATSVAFMRAAGAGLGCATSAPFTSDVAEQPFEYGSMLWVAEWGTISVLSDSPDGHYEAYDDLFDPEKSEPAPLDSADPNLIEPRQGFGK